MDAELHFADETHAIGSVGNVAHAVPREVRNESASLAAEFKSLAAATVIEGPGFRAAICRRGRAG